MKINRLMYVAKKYGGIGLKNDAKLLLRKIKRKIKKLVVKRWKEKFQYYIKEKKNAVDVRLVMPSVRRGYFYGRGRRRL